MGGFYLLCSWVSIPLSDEQDNFGVKYLINIILLVPGFPCRLSVFKQMPSRLVTGLRTAVDIEQADKGVHALGCLSLREREGVLVVLRNILKTSGKVLLGSNFVK